MRFDVKKKTNLKKNKNITEAKTLEGQGQPGQSSTEYNLCFCLFCAMFGHLSLRSKEYFPPSNRNYPYGGGGCFMELLGAAVRLVADADLLTFRTYGTIYGVYLLFGLSKL